jgi:predicted MFS family arabinose efflux permease
VVEKRERVGSVVETSWGLSSLIGLPLSGLLMTITWRLPFWIFAGYSLMVGVTLQCLPKRPEKKIEPSEKQLEEAGKWCDMMADPDVIGLLVLNMVACLSNDLLMIVWGIWLEEAYHFTLQQVALATFCIGVGDLTAVRIPMPLQTYVLMT